MPKGIRFDQDESVFAQPPGVRLRRKPWRRTSKGFPWGAQRAMDAFRRAGFTETEAQDLVFKSHIRSTSPIGRSLVSHRRGLIQKYMSEGLGRDEAVAWASDFMEGIADREDYKMIGLVEALTYHRRFVDEEVVRGVDESVSSAVDRWQAGREKVRERRYGSTD